MTPRHWILGSLLFLESNRSIGVGKGARRVLFATFSGVVVRRKLGTQWSM